MALNKSEQKEFRQVFQGTHDLLSLERVETTLRELAKDPEKNFATLTRAHDLASGADYPVKMLHEYMS